MKQWTVADLMTREVVVARPDMTYKDVADLLVTRMVSAVPVVDREGRVLGVVSEVDLLPKIEYADRLPHHPLATRRMATSGVRSAAVRSAGRTAADAMTAPAITISPDAMLAQAARRLDAARVKRLPVVDDRGVVVGVVSRRDLLRLYTRTDAAVAADVLDVLSTESWSGIAGLEAPTRAGVVTLLGAVGEPRTARLAEEMTRAVPGVIGVVNRLLVDAQAPDGASVPRWRS